MFDESAELWVKAITDRFSIDPNSPDLWDTPRRVARAFDELLEGHKEDATEIVQRYLSVTFPTKSDELVLLLNLQSAGMCPHHFLPVLYSIDFAYVPEHKALGLSKVSRVVKLLTSRAELQENITTHIVDTFYESLECRGVACVVTGFHTCMAIRGAQAREAITITSGVRGMFATNKDGIKDEFMKLRDNSKGFTW